MKITVAAGPKSKPEVPQTFSYKEIAERPGVYEFRDPAIRTFKYVSFVGGKVYRFNPFQIDNAQGTEALSREFNPAESQFIESAEPLTVTFSN